MVVMSQKLCEVTVDDGRLLLDPKNRIRYTIKMIIYAYNIQQRSIPFLNTFGIKMLRRTILNSLYHLSIVYLFIAHINLKLDTRPLNGADYCCVYKCILYYYQCSLKWFKHQLVFKVNSNSIVKSKYFITICLTNDTLFSFLIFWFQYKYNQTISDANIKWNSA